jgi:hypothetical protein
LRFSKRYFKETERVIFGELANPLDTFPGCTWNRLRHPLGAFINAPALKWNVVDGTRIILGAFFFKN